MKRHIYLLTLLLLLTCSLLPAAVYEVSASSGTDVPINPVSPFRGGEFFGIWIGAEKTLDEAVADAYNTPLPVRPVQVFLTTDWSNLNKEPWYVLTAGMYSSRSEAELLLPQIQKYYPDAYIKHSGTRLGSVTGNTSSSAGTVQSPERPSPFYGIWCEADKNYSEATKYAERWRNTGFSVHVILTTRYSNLNPEPWYAVTVGMYGTETEAYNNLAKVQAVYGDAYVKYSGDYIGPH